MANFDTALPIDAFIPEILETISRCGALVIQAEPGAGKTTRVPAAIMRSGVLKSGDICVLEPRRLAARMTARHVASREGVPLGGLVGYQVRFEDRVSSDTALRFMTEGILVRRLLTDRTLSGTGMVVLDEVHERHLDTDTALAACRKLQKTTRPDLKILVMSATMDADRFSRFLGGAPVVKVPGRTFPVSVEHLERIGQRPLEDLLAEALGKILKDPSDDGGDILAFLPGAGEIRRCWDRCAPLAERSGIQVKALHGDLSPEDQDDAVADRGGRRLILSTNIAESSLTLPRVTCVIDSGLARVLKADASSSIPSLQVERVPRSSCIQRTGRAGRIRPGRCIRLYSKEDFQLREEHSIPEILRSDLTETALLIHGLGERRLSDMDWPDAPPQSSVDAAESLLSAISAVDPATGQLTDDGKSMLKIPVHPRLSRMMVEASRQGAGRSGALAAAILSEKDIHEVRGSDMFARGASGGQKAKDGVAESDVVATMEEFEAAARSRFSPGMLRSFGLSPTGARTVEKTFSKLARFTGPDRQNLTPQDRDRAIRFALLASHPDRVARRQGGRSGTGRMRSFVLCTGGDGELSPQSQVTDSEFIVATALEERGKGAARSLTIRSASEIQEDWLIDLFEDDIREESDVVWNDRLERAEGRSRLLYRKLVLSESACAPDEAQAAQLLHRKAMDMGLRNFADEGAIQALRIRTVLFSRCFPESGVMPLDQEVILSALRRHCQGKRSFQELRDDPFIYMLRGEALGDASPRMDRLFPEHVELTNGRRVKVHYEEDRPPWIESRLQDFFGQKSTPAIAEGRLRLVIHLLAPSQRPLQVTDDLESFWKTHYPELRNALARRYPKHYWPENPLVAEPPPPNRRKPQ